MELVVAFLGLWALLALAPDAPICRTLHHALVVLPARAIGLITRGHVAGATGLVAIAALAFWLVDHELLFVMSLMAPEALAYLAMFEISTLVEVIVTTSIVAGSTRFPRVTSALRLIRARSRATRTRRPQRPTPSNDDEGPEYALAA